MLYPARFGLIYRMISYWVTALRNCSSSMGLFCARLSRMYFRWVEFTRIRYEVLTYSCTRLTG